VLLYVLLHILGIQLLFGLVFIWVMLNIAEDTLYQRIKKEVHQLIPVSGRKKLQLLV